MLFVVNCSVFTRTRIFTVEFALDDFDYNPVLARCAGISPNKHLQAKFRGLGSFKKK